MKTYKKLTEVKIYMVNQGKMLENYTKTIKKAGKVNRKKPPLKFNAVV
jgi:hypothetical protein